MIMLMVDDTEDLCYMVQMFLAKSLREFVSVGNGADAIGIVERRMAEKKPPFDIALVDIGLPGGIDGIKVCGRIRALTPQTRVIISSGLLTEERKELAMAAGAEDILVKPYKPQVLFELFKIPEPS